MLKMFMENMDAGIDSCLLLLFGAISVSKVLTWKTDRKQAALKWLGVTGIFIVVFMVYLCISTVSADYIIEMESRLQRQTQLGNVVFTLLNVAEGVLFGIFLVLGTLWIYKEPKADKVFAAVLVALFELVIWKFLSNLTYFVGSHLFQGGQMPWTGVKNKINLFLWLLAIEIIFYKFVADKIKNVLDNSAGQIRSFIKVPVFSFGAFILETSIFETFNMVITSENETSWFIALTAMSVLLIIYIMMYWAVFKGINISASSMKVKAELDVASKIQLSAVPSKFPAYPERKEFDIFATMHPAKEVGGDFYDFFLVDDDHMAILIADVSGKGVPAALFMMSGRAIIRNQMMLGMELGEVLRHANNQLVENNEEGMFITAFIGIVELSTGKFSYANAGHNPIFICHEDGKVDKVPARAGFVLGGMAKIKYRSNELRLRTGDQIILYTDGVTEAVNPKLDMYQEDRLIKTLSTCGEKTAKETVLTIVDSVNTFADGADQADDITVLVFKGQRNYLESEEASDS